MRVVDPSRTLGTLSNMTTALDTLFVRDTPLRILVVGDVMMDGYLEGDVGRTSPEAPVPVVLSKNTRQVAGGAANVGLGGNA